MHMSLERRDKSTEMRAFSLHTPPSFLHTLHTPGLQRTSLIVSHNIDTCIPCIPFLGKDYSKKL